MGPAGRRPGRQQRLRHERRECARAHQARPGERKRAAPGDRPRPAPGLARRAALPAAARARAAVRGGRRQIRRLWQPVLFQLPAGRGRGGAPAPKQARGQPRAARGCAPGDGRGGRARARRGRPGRWELCACSACCERGCAGRRGRNLPRSRVPAAGRPRRQTRGLRRGRRRRSEHHACGGACAAGRDQP